jgi:hypothetical protein
MKNSFNSSLTCSFCGERRSGPEVLIKSSVSSNVVICQICISVAVEITAIELRRRREQFGQKLQLETKQETS